jgi:hypothetical protein
MTPKATRLKHKRDKIHSGYGNWEKLLTDAPVRRREEILRECIASERPKQSAKYPGNQ